MEKELYTSIGKIVNQCADQIFKYTPQIFYIENENEPIRPIALASCILYENAGNYYLITASHVFEYEEIELNKIGILINDVLSLLHGFLIYTNDKENKIDLAIMKLSDHFVKDILEQYSFLNDDFLNINHELINKQQYLMAGFPVSKTRIYDKTHKREELVSLTQPSKDEKYEELNFNRDEHIIVDIDKVKDFDNIELILTPPHLYGVSGSGLWFIPDISQPKFSLVAIMTEWHKKNKVTIGTKIDVAINIIKNQLDNEYSKALEKNRLPYQKNYF